MKIPPKKPHFFKPIQKGFKNGIKIPIGFLKYLKGQDQIKHVVLRRGGKSWLVKVNGCQFEAGWAAFVEEHDLQLGDLLIFRHEGNMEFEVSIFDSSHCNREYEEYLQEEEGYNNVEETSKNFGFKGKSNLCILSSSKVFPHADAGTHNSCSPSHFVCTVEPYCITKGFLRLPRQFAMENDLINKKCGVIIIDERQRSWYLRLATYDSSVRVFDGWDEFRVANDLNEGDYMMFEVIANGEKPIWKFHDKPNRSIVSTRKVFPKEESATHSSSGQSHFVCTVKPYCLSKSVMFLPKRFALANDLINKKCGLVIRDERQRSWNLRLITNNTRVKIGEGWHEFCVDNDLKAGDCITFEVVTNGVKPIWKFHGKSTFRGSKLHRSVLSNQTPESSHACPYAGAATHKPFDQSHLVCIVRPYCLVNDLLHIPTKFALANGLTNKRCKLIIRGERERSWNVRLRSFGNSVCIGAGWNEFRDANCLKEGDCIMFDVVSNGKTPIWKYNGKVSGKDAKHHRSHWEENMKQLGDWKGN